MDKKGVRFKWQRLLIGLALLILVIIVLLKFAELQQIADLLKKVNCNWFFIALVLQFGVLATMAGFYKTILKKTQFWHLLKTTMAMVFADHALPSFSASGNVLLYYSSTKKNVKKGLSSWLVALNVFINLFFYFIIFVIGLIYLLLSKKMMDTGLIWASIAVLAVLFVLLFRIMWTKTGSRHFRAFVSFLLKKWPGVRKSVLKILSEFYDTKKIVGKKDISFSLIFVFFSYLFRIAVIGAIFLALGHLIDPGILITGYFITALISSISYIRIGVYELAMTATFAGLGVGYNLALTATLLYRLVSFWLPMLLGFLAFNSLMNEEKKK